MEGNPISRYVFLALICLGLLILIKRKINLSTIIKTNCWLFILYFYTLISIGWAEYPAVSIKRWILISGSLIMVILILLHDNFQGAFEHLFRRYVFICITLSFVFVKFYKNIGFSTGRLGSRVWTGIAPGKNALGMLCAISLLFLIWRSIKLKAINILDVFPFLMGTYLLTRAGSATANVLTISGLILLYGISILQISFKKMMILTLTLMLLSSGILAFFTSSSITDSSEFFYRAANRDPTLTGRVPMWQDLLRIGRKHSITGSGYESFWLENLAVIWEKYSFGPLNAHNGYIDIYLNLGIIGLMIMIIFILKSLARLVTESALASYHGKIALVFTIIFLLRNITESSFMSVSLIWFLLLAFSINVEEKQAATESIALHK